MDAQTTDIAIIGGGLAGGLIALALAQHRPDVSVRLVEAGESLGGNHRWSWFGSDVGAGGKALLAHIPKAEWADGNRVAFPLFERRLDAPYYSISSADFAAALEKELAPDTVMLNAPAASVHAGGAALADGTRITARAVIDARGFTSTPHLQGGWQVFMGRHLRTQTPHGLTRPIIMDARVEQLGGYRFVYVLPLGENDLFIEDTYYQDTPDLDGDALSSRIDTYCQQHGWTGHTIAAETGVLPVITGGSFESFVNYNGTPGVALAGARGGFTHPLTSYTLPFAVETALAVAANADLSGSQLAALLHKRAASHWRATAYYRLLGSMLFGAARPRQRYRIFQRFYRLPEPLIERFYAARSTAADKARILLGRPPVPLSRAVGALFSSRPALSFSQKDQAS